MKRQILLITLAVTTFVSTGIAFKEYRMMKGWEQGIRINNLNKQVAIDFKMIQQVDSTDIVYFGDSITEWMNLETLGENSKNRGIAGETTVDGLKRIGFVAKGKPKKIFIMMGVNDIGLLPVEKTTANMSAIIDTILYYSPSTKIFVESVLPSNRDAIETEKINKLYKAECNRRNIVFINEFPLFEKEKAIDPAYTTDGIHLNIEGYKIRLSTLKQFI